MLTLSLLRHGKSSWEQTGIDDHERPLAKRGRTAAEAVGAFMAERRLRPDLILCSDAARTRETLERVLPHFPPPPPEVILDRGLYLASATLMLARLRQTASEVRQLLMIGHNPGMHALALELVGLGQRADIAAMATKFPTAALAVLTFDVGTWAEVRPAGGRLVLFMTPRQLA
jgi:phosphohistidine phosphatase